MFGLPVVEHHVAWITRTGGHTMRAPAVGVRRNVWPAYGGNTLVVHGLHKAPQPVLVRHAVCVRIGDHLPSGMLGTNVASVTESMIRLTNVVDMRELARYFRCVIPRTIVDE